jgi:hypothetical protein
MVQVATGNTNMPYRANTRDIADSEMRRPFVNSRLVIPEFFGSNTNERKEKVLEMTQRAAGLRGSELNHPSRIELYIKALQGKPTMSQLDRFKKNMN